MNKNTVIYLSEQVPVQLNSFISSDGKLYLDAGELHIPVSRVTSTINRLGSISDEGVLDVILPASSDGDSINDLIFDAFVNANTTDTKRLFINVFVLVEGLFLPMTRLYVNSKSANGDYSVTLKRGSEHWIESSQNRYLYETNHGILEYTFDFVQNNRSTNDSYQDGGVDFVLPSANFGGLSKLKSDFVGNQRSFIYILPIVRKGLAAMGWSFESPYLESDYGRRQAAYLTSKESFSDTDSLNQRKFIGSSDGVGQELTFNNPKYVYKFTEITQGGHNYDVGTGRITASSISTWRLTGIARAARIRAAFPRIKIQIIKTLRTGTSGVQDQRLVENLDVVFANKDDNLVTGTTGSNSFYEDSIEIEAKDILLREGEFLEVFIDCLIPDTSTGAEPSSETPSIHTSTSITFEMSLISEPSSIIYNIGDTLNVSDSIDKSITLMDFFQGVFHPTGNGNFYTDWNLRKVYHYPPFQSQIGGDNIEGFIREDLSPVDLVPVIIDDTMSVSSERNEIDRFELVGFKSSSDNEIEKLSLEENNDLHSHLYDRGDVGFGGGVQENLNTLFEPSLNKEFLFTGSNGSGVPTDMLTLSDNSDGEISFDIKPRLVLIHPYQAIQRFDGAASETQTYYLEGQRVNPLLAYNAPLSTTRNETGAEIEDRLVYGVDKESLFEKFWKKVLNRFSFSRRYAFDICMDYLGFRETDFRRLVRIKYLGRTFDTVLKEITYKEEDICSVIVEQNLSLSEEATDTSTPTNSCNNNFEIIITRVTGGYVATSTDSFSSTPSTDVWEYSIDNGSTFVTYASGVTITTNESIIFRRTVNFVDGCNQLFKIKSSSFNLVCDNNASIKRTVIDAIGSMVKFEEGDGDSFSDTPTNTWTQTINSVTTPYTVGSVITLNDGETVEIERALSFANCPNYSIFDDHTYNASEFVIRLQCADDGFGGFSPSIDQGNSVIPSQPIIQLYYYSRDAGTTWNLFTGRSITNCDTDTRMKGSFVLGSGDSFDSEIYVFT